MNANQRKFFYFPAWNACAKANRWVMERGRLVADLAAQSAESLSEPAGEERRKVIAQAETLAAREHRAVKPDDLRHACNLLASAGKTKHTEDMDNHATTMAVRRFNLLTDPESLDAVMIWLNPAEADRRDYIAYMERTVHEAKLIAISQNAWGTSDWRSQGMDQLRWLNRQAQAGPRPARVRQPDPENEPY